MLRLSCVALKSAALLIVVTLTVSSGALAYERTLAGLHLGRSAMTVLQRYGDPTRITVGTVAVAATVGADQQQQHGYDPYGLGSTMPMSMPNGGVSPYMPFAGDYSPPSPGMLMPLPGIGGPPMSMPEASGPAGPGERTATITQQEVTWNYDLPGGVTLEVIVAEGGLISQITVAGAARWAASRTAQGIQLGNMYKDVLYKYGYPEAHIQAGRFLRVSYVDKHRCLFTLLDKKVVGITIAFNE